MDAVKNLELLSSFLTEATNTLTMQAMKKRKMKYCCAKCPDPQCSTMMYFPAHEVSVECYGCGQRHSTATLPNRTELSEEQQFQKNLSEIKLMYGGKKTAELVKVKGISNYQCKLLSPLLTTHGKDKNDLPRPLSELGMGSVFDCSKLASRAFAIESNLLSTKGYGEDKSGSSRYLQDTLAQISAHNGGRRGLVPVHADGDGHCLVHAISRCLVGRELFWHALRQNMKDHLETNRDQYIELMKDFLSEEEWPEIVAEAAPDYQPPDGQALGLRTVHIFALANVLRRPIILLDSIAGMQTKGEYSGIFLPALLSPELCTSPDNVLNSPIVIAWSNAGYNHFIPLVPIKDEPLPKLPHPLQPEVWGVNKSLLSNYILTENDGSVIVGRGKPLQDNYLQKLVICMEQLFFTIHGVLPSLVADFNQHVYRSAGYVAMSLEMVTMETKIAIEERRLFKCLICSGLSCIPEDWLKKNGTLYDIAKSEYSLKNGEKYTFPRYGVTAEYRESDDTLLAFEVDCFLCKHTARIVNGKGEIAYENGDRTSNRSDPRFTKCCGYKHYWDGNEYDNLPEVYPLQLTWKGRQKTIKVYWFQNESDPSLNSNMYEVASKVVAENYPAEFGDEQLVQQVVEMLLQATEKPSESVEHSSTHESMETDSLSNIGNLPSTKAIAMGMSNTGTKVLHKEELGISETERMIKKRVDDKIQSKKALSFNDGAAAVSSGSGTKGGRKTSPTPLSRDHSSTVSPPSKISTAPKPSPPSPGNTTSKKIRVTTSEGKTVNLTLSNTATFGDLQMMIQNELGVPSNCQRIRWGFPPKELRPPGDDTPLSLSHGERISVEWIGQPSTGSKRLNDGSNTSEGLKQQRPSSANAPGGSSSSLIDQINSLLSDTRSFEQLQKYPHLFRKGGHCYEELCRSYGNKLTDGMHLQFAEMSDITFMLNKKDECLEVCLGIEHVPVGSLTKEQLELAREITAQNTSGHATDTRTGDVESVKYKLNRPGSTSNVKAFSGAGRTLGGGAATDDARLEGVAGIPNLEEELHNLDDLLGKTQVVLKLRTREASLQKEVRALNQRLLNIHSGDEVVEDDEEALELERKLLTLSSDLKHVRDQIKGLSDL